MAQKHERRYPGGKYLKHGLVEGPGRGREYEITPDVYLKRRGGHFVKMSTKNGVATPCSSVDHVWGWAECPPNVGATYPAWKSSSGDRVFVIHAGDGNVFAMPVNEADASLNGTSLGKGGCIFPSGSNYGSDQKFYLEHQATDGSATASQLICVDYDKGNKIAYVKVKSADIQWND